MPFKGSPHARSMEPVVVSYFSRRVELFIEPAASRLKGKRVLDLACFTGVLSWPVLALGAAEVVGVEARKESIEEATALFAGSRYAERARFVTADLFDFLRTVNPGDFDVILCAGFLYHTVRQVEFFREMKRLAPGTLILDTSVAKNYWWFGRRYFGRAPGLFLYAEDTDLKRNTTDPDGVVFWPTVSFIETMARGASFEPRRMRFPRGANGDWRGLEDHRKGLRAAWICDHTKSLASA